MIPVPSVNFKQELERLLRKNPNQIKKVEKCLSLMRVDINHPSLRLHKLNKRNYSVSVDMKIRIIVGIDGKYIHLLKIGNHDEVY